MRIAVIALFVVSGSLACILGFFANPRSSKRSYLMSIVFGFIAGFTLCLVVGENDLLFPFISGIIVASSFAFSIWWDSCLKIIHWSIRKRK